MLLDKRSTFARDLSIPAAATGQKFGEALPLDVRSNQGEGNPMYLVVGLPVVGAGGTSFSLEFVTASDAALTQNVESLGVLGTWALAALTPAGKQLYAGQMPQGFYQTFIGLRHTTVGTFSAGKINAFLIDTVPSWRAYANNNM